MAITQTQKIANKSSTNTSSYSTASLTASANKLYLIGVMLYGSGTTPTASVSGGGLGSWTKIAEATNSNNVCASIHRAMSSSPGAAAAVTITGSGACTGAAWDIEEFDGIDTSGTNGSGAIGSFSPNTIKGTATNGTATLTSVASDSAVYACFAIDNNEAMTASGSYTKLTEQQAATEGDTFASIYLNPGTTTPKMTWTSSVIWAGASVEIKIASTGFTAKFRRTLSGIGGKVGARQIQGMLRGMMEAANGLWLPERMAA